MTTTWGTSLYPGLASNPNTLATTPSLNYNEVTGCNATLPAADGGSAAAFSAASNACNTSGIPGFTSNSNQTTPNSTVLNAIKTITMPTTLGTL